MNDLLSAFSWWLAATLIGLAALPLCLHWLRWLPDRGYFFAKPLGILLVSYALWLSASFSLLDNTRLTAALLVIALAAACWLRDGRAALAYWSERRRFILGCEALFLLAFAAMVVVRAYNPAIAATEKPMEIAFLSASMRSAQFPPLDPWLSGFGISYYYFGYVAMAMLAGLAGVAAPVAFNLSIALLFALTVGGAFSLGYDLAARGRPEGRGPAGCGLLAGLFVAVAANYEAVVEVLNSKGILSPAFSRWLQIKDMPPPGAGSGWLPTDNWWWFRAARVIMDVNPATGASRDYTINEFPFFSFLLGDLHPHLLALPFVVLAVAVSLNLLFSEDEWTANSLRYRRLDWMLFGLVFGGLGFLNSWDMPAYLLLFVAAFALRRFRPGQRWGILLREMVVFGGLVLLACIALYLPFYIGFRSQLQGLGFVLVHSKLHHFAIFWAPLFFFAVSWILAQLRAPANGLQAQQSHLASGMTPVATGPGGDQRPAAGRQPASASSGHLPKVTTTTRPSPRADIPGPLHPIYIPLAVAVAASLFLNAEVTALLLILLTLGAFALWRHLGASEADRSAGFVWLLVLVALFLITVCEWVFIRDFFGNRMNTVFKLYYQSWVMLAVAGAYVLYSFAIRPLGQGRRPRSFPRSAWLVAAVLVVAASLVYPLAATWAKTDGFADRPTLDGQAFMARSSPDDDEAIRWLQSTVQGAPVILEATGGSYSAAGRVSAFTGLPSVLGWDFHEQQWRGNYDEQGPRKAAIETIYSSTDRAEVLSLLQRYRVRYVYVGPLEREQYGKYGPEALEKFATFMDVVHRNPGVTIYRMRS